nr:atherin-like [Aegilops tauschii subsp. strangulata]
MPRRDRAGRRVRVVGLGIAGRPSRLRGYSAPRASPTSARGPASRCPGSSGAAQRRCQLTSIQKPDNGRIQPVHYPDHGRTRTPLLQFSDDGSLPILRLLRPRQCARSAAPLRAPAGCTTSTRCSGAPAVATSSSSPAPHARSPAPVRDQPSAPLWSAGRPGRLLLRPPAAARSPSGALLRLRPHQVGAPGPAPQTARSASSPRVARLHAASPSTVLGPDAPDCPSGRLRVPRPSGREAALRPVAVSTNRAHRRLRTPRADSRSPRAGFAPPRPAPPAPPGRLLAPARPRARLPHLEPGRVRLPLPPRAQPGPVSVASTCDRVASCAPPRWLRPACAWRLRPPLPYPTGLHARLRQLADSAPTRTAGSAACRLRPDSDGRLRRLPAPPPAGFAHHPAVLAGRRLPARLLLVPTSSCPGPAGEEKRKGRLPDVRQKRKKKGQARLPMAKKKEER